MQAIIVTEFEREIINRLREASNNVRCLVCMPLGLPYTEEMLQGSMEEYKENYKDRRVIEDHKRWLYDRQVETEKIYRAHGNKEPLAFGTKKAVAFISTLEERKV